MKNLNEMLAAAAGLRAAGIGKGDRVAIVHRNDPAFVVPRKGAPLDKADIMRYCREKFDAYKRPRDVEFVDSLPKNALGKALKRSLRARSAG